MNTRSRRNAKTVESAAPEVETAAPVTKKTRSTAKQPKTKPLQTKEESVTKTKRSNSRKTAPEQAGDISENVNSSVSINVEESEEKSKESTKPTSRKRSTTSSKTKGKIEPKPEEEKKEAPALKRNARNASKTTVEEKVSPNKITKATKAKNSQAQSKSTESTEEKLPKAKSTAASKKVSQTSKKSPAKEAPVKATKSRSKKNAKESVEVVEDNVPQKEGRKTKSNKSEHVEQNVTKSRRTVRSTKVEEPNVEDKKTTSKRDSNKKTEVSNEPSSQTTRSGRKKKDIPASLVAADVVPQVKKQQERASRSRKRTAAEPVEEEKISVVEKKRRVPRSKTAPLPDEDKSKAQFKPDSSETDKKIKNKKTANVKKVRFESEDNLEEVKENLNVDTTDNVPDNEDFEIINMEDIPKEDDLVSEESVAKKDDKAIDEKGELNEKKTAYLSDEAKPIETEKVLSKEVSGDKDSPLEEASKTSDIKQNGDRKVISESDIETTHKRKLSLVSEESVLKRIRVDENVGDLFTFGDELVGELGPRDTTYLERKVKRCEPARVKLSDKVRQVACGAYHTIVLAENGRVITFGCNDDSSLGRTTSRQPEDIDGSDDDSDVDDYEEKMSAKPLPVTELKSNAIKVSAGDMHAAALCDDGDVFIWGNLKDDSNKIGLFIDDESQHNDCFPTRIPRKVELDKKAVDIASGSHHFLILTEDGQVYSLGEGSKGQLGRVASSELTSIQSNRELFLKAQPVNFPDDVSIKRVFASQWSSYALTEDGVLYAWGLNNYYQLGFKTEKPVQIDMNTSQNGTLANLLVELYPVRIRTPNDFKVAMVSNGQQHLLVLDTEGKIYSCGSALYGKLGHGKDFVDQCGEDRGISYLKEINPDSFNNEAVVHIECGDFCSMAITESGKLYTWGQGSLHIGTNSEEDRFEPQTVGGAYAENAKFFFVSSGPQFAASVGILKS